MTGTEGKPDETVNKTREELKPSFEKRDILFLVDDAESMQPHWKDVTAVLKSLVEHIDGLNEGGNGLCSATGKVGEYNIHGWTDYEKTFSKVTCDKGTKTDMGNTLENIFQGYINPEMVDAEDRTDTTLIVLTDGLWAAMPDKLEPVKNLIKDNLLAKMAAQGMNLKARPFSIQLVQFGDLPGVKARFDNLDNFLKGHEKYTDMVDTVRWTDPVDKILLGSFVESYDEQAAGVGQAS